MALNQVGRPQELGGVAGAGPLVDLVGGADLLEVAHAHQGDAIRDGHGLVLVVRNQDKGQAQLLLQAPKLHLHLGPQLGIEGAHGLVEQKHLGFIHQRPGQGHPLLLAARELVGQPLGEALELQHLQPIPHPPLHLGLAHAAALEAKGDVFPHRQVGKKGVALKHGIDRALVGGQGGDVFAHQHNPALGGHLEAGNNPQQGGFATARRPQKGEELTHGNLEAYPPQRGEVTEFFDHVLYGKGFPRDWGPCGGDHGWRIDYQKTPHF